jgi:uncharacterized protein
MIGILVALIVSWLLLYLIEKRSLLALGFLPVSTRLKQLGIGFLITATLCIAVEMLQLFLQASTLQRSENIDLTLLLSLFWWDIKSVLTEELIFRGALLYILIQQIGAKKGAIISAATFGIYHWFSFEILGNLFPMLIVFLGTGLMGYAWALAFVKTKSIFLPLGMHLGWNLTFNSIFSNGPLGTGLLTAQGGQPSSDWFSLLGLWVVPLLVFLIVRYFIPSENLRKKQEKNVIAPEVEF